MNLTLTERYLAGYHDKNPGVTARSFAARPVTNGAATFASTYAALLAALPDTGVPLTVLDLACGDGHLLGRWPRRLQRIGAWLAPSFEAPHFETLTSTRDCTPAQLWDWFSDMYDTDLLTPAALAGFRSDHLGALQPLCGPSGTLADTDCYQLFTAKANE